MSAAKPGQALKLSVLHMFAGDNELSAPAPSTVERTTVIARLVVSPNQSKVVELQLLCGILAVTRGPLVPVIVSRLYTFRLSHFCHNVTRDNQ